MLVGLQGSVVPAELRGLVVLADLPVSAVLADLLQGVDSQVGLRVALPLPGNNLREVHQGSRANLLKATETVVLVQHPLINKCHYLAIRLVDPGFAIHNRLSRLDLIGKVH